VKAEKWAMDKDVIVVFVGCRVHSRLLNARENIFCIKCPACPHPSRHIWSFVARPWRKERKANAAE